MDSRIPFPNSGDNDHFPAPGDPDFLRSPQPTIGNSQGYQHEVPSVSGVYNHPHQPPNLYDCRAGQSRKATGVR
jgi:hypothetical protein